MPADGVLVVDKPGGLTSHDVVAVARRALGETRIGHTGTLDPLATGVLPLACGRATRLARFLSASDKDYDATIRFGITTDSYDITGSEATRSGRQPDRDAVVRALGTLTGGYLQTPPAFSAKRVGGTRAYHIARGGRVPPPGQAPADGGPAVTLTPVPVTVSRAELLAFDGATARVAITCSAGFYVRSFAHALGEQVGTGACLEALRRTRSGEFSLDDAMTVEELMRPGAALDRLAPLRRLLPAFPAASLTSEGIERVAHGREVDAAHIAEADLKVRLYVGRGGSVDPPSDLGWVRLLAPDGDLAALATPGSQSGSLHPAVVLLYN